MSDLKLTPGRRERLGDMLYGQLLDQIVSGALTEGEKLPSENKICQAFQVSRPTVRAALTRLHADGLVTTRQGSGTFVQKRPSDHLMRLAKVSDVAGMLRCLEIRIALEGQAATLAALRHTPKQLERIKATLDALKAGFKAVVIPARADFEFHLAVAEASGNELFAELLGILHDPIEQAMTLALSLTRAGSAERARRVIDEHEAIFDAVGRGDAEAAGLAMRYHLHRARQRLTDRQRDK